MTSLGANHNLTKHHQLWQHNLKKGDIRSTVEFEELVLYIKPSYGRFEVRIAEHMAMLQRYSNAILVPTLRTIIDRLTWHCDFQPFHLFATAKADP